MLHSHFSGVLHLLQAQAVQLSQCSGSHRTSSANLSLAAAFGTGNGGVVLDKGADDAGGSQTTEDLIVGQMAGLLHIPQNCGQNTAGTTGRSGDDDTVVSILLGNGECVGADLAALSDLGNFGGKLLVVQILGLALNTQTAGQCAGGLQAGIDGCLHGVPNFPQEIPNFRAFIQFYIVTEAVQIAPLAEVPDFSKGMLRVNVLTTHIGAAQDADITAANGFHAHIADLLAFAQCDEVQGVGVRTGQILLGEYDFSGQRSQHFPQYAIGTMANAGLAQRAVQNDPEGICVRIFLTEDLSGTGRTHGVGRGRTYANLIYIFDGFHGNLLHYVIVHNIITNVFENYNGFVR